MVWHKLGKTMFCTIFYTFRYSNRNIKINKKTRVSVEKEYQNYLPSNLKVGGESERERERERIRYLVLFSSWINQQIWRIGYIFYLLHFWNALYSFNIDRFIFQFSFLDVPLLFGVNLVDGLVRDKHRIH